MSGLQIGPIRDVALGIYDGPHATPKEADAVAHVLEPDRGTVLDPACGSGGMFVQSARIVEEHGQSPTDELTFFGLEKNATTIRLAKMNLAVHGLEGDIEKAITYYEAPHELVGKADYVMANPPFNVDEIDAVSNGNYVWISYFYSYLNERGRAGFVMSSQASSAADIGVLSMEDRTWIPLLDAEANEHDPQVSPDGEWIAYSSDEAGRYQVYVERFPELGARQRISAETGRHPLWSASGDELLYVGAESTFFAVPVETGTVLTTGTPEVLFQWASFGAQIAGFPERQHDITQNGERFLLLDTPGIVAGASEIIIVENWSTELERRVPRD